MASKETDQYTTRSTTMIECAGTWLKAAVDILRNNGAVPETLLPFKINTTMYTGNENTFYVTAATHKITAYFNLQRNLANWRAWLVQHGPILVDLNVDATWDNATATGGKLDTFQPSTIRGGHAWRWSATQPTSASSCVTAGAPPGAIRASAMPARPISMRPSTTKATG